MKQRAFMRTLCAEPLQGILDEPEIVMFTYLETDQFSGDRINDGRTVSAFLIAVIQIRDITEIDFMRSVQPELPFQMISFAISFQQPLCCLTAGICLAHFTGDPILPFQAPDLVYTELLPCDPLHHHVYHPGAFRISFIINDLLYNFDIFFILKSLDFGSHTIGRVLQACVERRLGYSDTGEDIAFGIFTAWIFSECIDVLAQLFSFRFRKIRNCIVQFLKSLISRSFHGFRNIAKDTKILSRKFING